VLHPTKGVLHPTKGVLHPTKGVLHPTKELVSTWYFYRVNVALKEWDVQTRALESGHVTLLMRKGGIVEQRGEFSIEHEKFWLYKTFLHQNATELRPSFQDLLRENPHAGKVELSSFAVVEKTWKLEDLSTILQLETHNALTADALERKYHYRNKPFVHALLLRVYTCEPVYILETPEYAGCVSWVQLEQSIEAQNSRPVLSDQDFRQFKTQFEASL
jgi:hypothetical protein